MRRSLSVAVVVVAACVAGYPNLSSRSDEVVTLDVTSHNFGTVTIGSNASKVITISPQNTYDDDNVTSIQMATNCPDFMVTPMGTLPARVYYDCLSMQTFVASGSSTTCTPRPFQFTAKFTPSQQGTQSCNVRIDYTSNTGSGSGSGSNVQSVFVMLQGTGALPAFAMEVTPAQLPFADQAVGGMSTAQDVKVKNKGTQALTVQGVVNGPYAVVAGSLAPHALAAGAEETYSLTCNPVIAGDSAGTLSFTTLQGPTGAVNLSCRGIVSTLTIVPNPVRFADTLVGAPPANQLVTITNGSASPSVTLSNFRFANGTSSEVGFVGMAPLPITLGPGDNLQVLLHYEAATAHPSGPLGTLVFAGNGSDRNVAINGQTLVGSIGTHPASVEFGPICAGAPVSRDVEIFANAAGDVTVSSLTPPSSPSLSVPNQAGALKGNHGTELTARVTLTPGTPGVIDDKFVINSNVPGAATHDVPIKATVLAAGVSPSPDKVHFGPAMLQMTTTGREVVISNCSASSLMVTGASIAGPDAADFTIVSPASAAKELAPAESMTFLVVMTPRTNGTKTAQLVVEHAMGTTTADLDGDGYGGAFDGPKDRETYYACSVGGGAAWAWPIAFALLALRRRRR